MLPYPAPLIFYSFLPSFLFTFVVAVIIIIIWVQQDLMSLLFFFPFEDIQERKG